MPHISAESEQSGLSLWDLTQRRAGALVYKHRASPGPPGGWDSLKTELIQGPYILHKPTMSHFVDQRETHMADHMDGIPFMQDSLLAIFGQENHSPIISQYIDAGDTATDNDTYYAYSSQYTDHTPNDSPLSASASLVSNGNNNNDSFYEQSNDSFIQISNEIHTSTTPLEPYVASSWRMPQQDWDLLTPTEFEQPPHFHADGIRSVPRYTLKQENHYFVPQHSTLPITSETLVRYTAMQPQQHTHQPQQQFYTHPQYTQHYQKHEHRPQLPTPEEDSMCIKNIVVEQVLTEQYIPQEAVRRLENYFERVKDVHKDDVIEIYTADENKTESEGSVTPTSPTKVTVKAVRVRKPRVRSKKSSAITVKKLEENDKEEAVQKPYVLIVDSLRENPVLWNKVQCMKKKGIYKCSHCPEGFSSLLELARHLDEYQVVRPYRCPFTDCPWYAIGLPRRAEVRRHCAAQHSHIIQFGCEKDAADPESSPSLSPGQEAEKFQCSSALCEKTFRRNDACQRHVKLVHRNPASRFNVRVNNLRDKYQTDDVEELLNLLKSTKSHK